MKRILSILCFTFLLSLLSTQVHAQEASGTGPGGTNKSMGRAIKRSKARAARKDARERRKLEKANQKAIREHHKRIQGKEVDGTKVLKRMKKSKKKANKANRHQHL